MSNLNQTVQAVLDKATSAPEGPPCLVFGAIDRQGNVLAKVASGVADKASGKPVQPDSIFCWYSCTKMIAGIALMQLVEQGKAELDAPVGKVLPELADAKLVDGSTAKTKITLRHLLTHTTGFGYTFMHPEIQQWVKKNGGTNEFEGTFDSIKTPLMYEPGTNWTYGVGVDWAGEYLHRVTGLTLGQYCQKNIFEPLGLKDAHFAPIHPDKKHRLVEMHQRSEDGKMSVRKHLKFTHDSSFDSGGAGCLGTVEDYLKIMVVLMNDGVGANGKRILKAETLKAMREDQISHIKPNPLEVEIDNPTPELTNKVQIYPGTDKGWGLTWLILKDDFLVRKAGSFTWAGLCNNQWCVDPTTGIATMILSQSFPYNDLPALMPWFEAEAEVYKTLQ